MKKLSKKLTLLGVLLFSMAVFAENNGVKDIHDERSRDWVKVDIDWGKARPIDIAKGRVTFIKCFDEACKKRGPIGKSKYYTIKELLIQQNAENGKMVVITALDVLVAIYGTVEAVEYAMVMGTNSALLYALGVYVAPTATVATVSALVKYVNPVHYYDQAQTITSKVIFDKDVTVDSMADYIKNLESTLDNIDP